jgi:glycosyltransferase involved in cell wall biosynthesis
VGSANVMAHLDQSQIPPVAKPLCGVTVGQFGHFDPGYARNRILAKALRRAGASVLEISDRRRFLARTPRLARAGWVADPDVLLVGFPGHSDVTTAKLVSLRRRVPVVLDALVSLWETNVLDRQAMPPRGLRQYRLRLTDRVACSLADAVVLDTDTHIEWFRATFGIPPGKLHRIWVGADDEIMTPCNASGADGSFTVFFYGSFIPLHGIEHILGAAGRLQAQDAEIRFVLCGSGQTLSAMRRLAAAQKLGNVEFLDRRPLPELRRLICDSDVCLGIFGTSSKARSVIPNKVFDALACARPVITGDTPAAHESFTHGKDVWLCPAGNAEALADAITTLKADPGARKAIAAAGHELSKRRFSLDAIASDVARVVLDVLDGARGRPGACDRFAAHGTGAL